jgi:hypothetical protein
MPKTRRGMKKETEMMPSELTTLQEFGKLGAAKPTLPLELPQWNGGARWSGQPRSLPVMVPS